MHSRSQFFSHWKRNMLAMTLSTNVESREVVTFPVKPREQSTGSFPSKWVGIGLQQDSVGWADSFWQPKRKAVNIQMLYRQFLLPTPCCFWNLGGFCATDAPAPTEQIAVGQGAAPSLLLSLPCKRSTFPLPPPSVWLALLWQLGEMSCSSAACVEWYDTQKCKYQSWLCVVVLKAASSRNSYSRVLTSK